MAANQNFRKAMAIEKKNKERLLAINPDLNERSGIYFLTRTDENGFKYAYIGQAVRILSRLAQHLSGYQHIDISLKKHGLYSDENPYGWKVGFLHFIVPELNEKEQYYIKLYASKGFQLRNKTSGSQGEGKAQIDEYKPSKGYRDGLRQGYKNASREIANLFEKHLNVSTKSDKPNKNQEKALLKFNNFLEFHKGVEQ